ncbi:phosphate/phosphite/phosphonate ABC transporter substrate-binding protein [Pseudomonas sp. PB120]|uniref:phosphate/phosphite/phosphonate ABC transporter substrate-binding protein n=1 Tax=Pseudomonas sp. PB120 TaxID=2494700 RepID=UPI0012FD99FC|nr:phosphate/phosphite/phosphonate ABC transporter substrate-binding protein [Pseudomonas sp. PB120]MVV46995.1 phosphate/phosphite/phosphonate ABC transporter substrate-binding protein [Pseudomonas sp. PB120]
MRLMMWIAAVLAPLMLTPTVNAQCTQQSLRMAVVPKKSMDELLSDLQPLVELLGTKLGMPVEIVPSSSYESVVDAVVSGGVDIAWLGPASYLLAYQRDPRIQPFASLTINHGYFTPAGHHYQALLVARREVATDIEALRNKKVALSDPASTSGSVVPNAEFSALVQQPLTRFFGSVVYSGSHAKSLDAVLDGKVDAAFVASVQADAYLNSGQIGRDTLHVLWRSAPIYYDPMVFSGTLCPKLKKTIREAVLNHQEKLASFLASQQASGIVPVSHAEYAPLLRMMQSVPVEQ